MLKFESNSSGGGGGESLAQTLVIGNTTGARDIIQTDGKVFRCNDENGLQFASTSGESHTNGGTAFTTLFSTNQFDIKDLAVNDLFFIRSLASSLLFQIGDTSLGNGAVMVLDDANSRSYINNTAQNVKVGINNNNPAVALDVVGEVVVKGSVQVGNGLAQNGTVQFQNDKDTTAVTITSNDAAVLNLDNATHDVKVGINNDSPTVALDVVGSVKISNLLSINGLTDYPTNAAAITGGLVVGDLYYTNVAGQATLKIVI